MTPMEIGHGGAAWIPLVNAIIYGAIGFVLGAFSGSRRNAIRWGTGFAIVLVLGMFAVPAASYVASIQRTARLRDGFEQRLKEDPKDREALFWMGVHHFSRTSDLREAEGYFRKFVELDRNGSPPSSKVQYSFLYLAIILQAQGLHDQADAMYTEFLNAQPDLENNLVLLNYSRDYQKRKSKDKDVVQQANEP
jgi:tetratricopeptide (TPR) repeat protein